MKKTNKTKIAVDLFNKFAAEYQNKFMDVGLYADALDLFCENITVPNAQVLEVACGPGNITRYLLNKRPDFKILGTDLAPNMLELATTNNPEATFLLMDAREIIQLNKKFDAMVCGFCLPYLTKEEAIQFICDAAEILHENGALYLSTMENDYNKSGWETSTSGNRVYMHYHESAYLQETMEQRGFHIINLKRKIYEYNGKQTTDLIIIARKG